MLELLWVNYSLLIPQSRFSFILGWKETREVNFCPKPPNWRTRTQAGSSCGPKGWAGGLACCFRIGGVSWWSKPGSTSERLYWVCSSVTLGELLMRLCFPCVLLKNGESRVCSIFFTVLWGSDAEIYETVNNISTTGDCSSIFDWKVIIHVILSKDCGKFWEKFENLEKFERQEWWQHPAYGWIWGDWEKWLVISQAWI